MRWGRYVTCFHQRHSPATFHLHVPPQIALPEILLNILDNHQKTLYRALIWYFVQLQCNIKFTILGAESGLRFLCVSPAMSIGSHCPSSQRLSLLSSIPRVPGRPAAMLEVSPSQCLVQTGTCGPQWRHEFSQTMWLSSKPLLKTPGSLWVGDKMGGKMTAIIFSCSLLGPSDLLSSVYCRRGHQVDLPPHDHMGMQATSGALKESREQKFCISDEPESVTHI